MRYAASLILGVVITLGLFFLMKGLIDLGKVGDSEEKSFQIVDFVRVKHESSIETKKRELPQKKTVEQQPTPPSMQIPRASAQGGQLEAISLAAAPPAMDSKVRISGGLSLGGVISDADIVPLVRITPMYPRAAAQRKIEGWVEIEFDIGITGGVENPQVVGADPPNIFNTEALRAISKWKYKPRIKDGKPVVTRGVRVRLKFNLEDM